jgi:LCP family protein required for cell wall assembly
MAEKLRVPPPQKARPGSRPGGGQQRRRASGRRSKRATTRRSRAQGWVLPLSAALVVACLVLAACSLSAGGPALFFPGEGGQVNVLLLGIDRRGGSDWTYRTDTIMVVGLGRDGGGAAMLSIPRDLQLTIPGYGEDRINTANVYGYLYDYPGGGPALLRATVEANFGVPIDGYLMLDFYAFEDIVDALGGIEVNVEEPLHDTRYPDPRPGDPNAYKTIHFDAGLQHMDGKRALAYARSRMSTSDFDRARRQQQILLAIRQKALSLSAIPRWPSLAATILGAIQTDLGPGKMAALALLSARTDPSHFEQVVLKSPYVTGYRRSDGAAVQLPNWELINPVAGELFRLPGYR